MTYETTGAMAILPDRSPEKGRVVRRRGPGSGRTGRARRAGTRPRERPARGARITGRTGPPRPDRRSLDGARYVDWQDRPAASGPSVRGTLGISPRRP
ncbi:hypothetical protein GCM10010140_71000 [Streptosporangium pseudovulgare]|uniref:Uncharacterized protein n=1 Tax=Streptosporangium pseudovulgare TaxID=35765 RepID=A0ABQ2RG99_9ACTN|nr:hypothetical protein GCM10010140_71000 [Streptosporangium pseudovulgare]